MSNAERSIMIIPGDGPGVDLTDGTSSVTSEAIFTAAKSIVITVANPNFNNMQSYAMVPSSVVVGGGDAGVILKLHYAAHAPISFSDAKSISAFCGDSSVAGLTPSKAEIFIKK